MQRRIQNAIAHASAQFDTAILRVALTLGPSRRNDEKNISNWYTYLTEMGNRYASLDPSSHYPEPPPIEKMRDTFVRKINSGQVHDLTWTSEYIPRLPEARIRFAQWRENTNGHVRLFRHNVTSSNSPRRPTIILLHGYRVGTYAFEEHIWDVGWFYRLGLDVALFTLPFHALRAPKSLTRTAPLFPGRSIVRTNEGFGQAIWDLRRFIRWLNAQGTSNVGLAGMSLGGYTASLLATVIPDLAFIIPYIPLADISDVHAAHEAVRSFSIPPDLTELSRRALSIHRPLGRTPLISGDRVLVVAGERDKITGHSQAERLAKHFNAQLVLFPGAHLIQFGRRQGFAAIRQFLVRLGLV